jgi:hypothetical protein
MAQKEKNESNNGIYTLIFLVLLLLGFWLFTPLKTMESTWHSELTQIINDGGTQTNEWILSQSMLLVRGLSINIIESADISSSSSLDSWLMERMYVTVIWLNLFGYRLFIAVMWALLCMPLVFASIIDGFYTREIYKETFISQSPVRHKMGVKTFNLLLVVVLIWLIIPIPIPVYVIPIIFIVKAISSWFWVSNLQKRL